VAAFLGVAIAFVAAAIRLQPYRIAPLQVLSYGDLAQSALYLAFYSVPPIIAAYAGFVGRSRGLAGKWSRIVAFGAIAVLAVNLALAAAAVLMWIDPFGLASRMVPDPWPEESTNDLADRLHVLLSWTSTLSVAGTLLALSSYLAMLGLAFMLGCALRARDAGVRIPFLGAAVIFLLADRADTAKSVFPEVRDIRADYFGAGYGSRKLFETAVRAEEDGDEGIRCYPGVRPIWLSERSIGTECDGRLSRILSPDRVSIERVHALDEHLEIWTAADLRARLQWQLYAGETALAIMAIEKGDQGDLFPGFAESVQSDPALFTGPFQARSWGWMVSLEQGVSLVCYRGAFFSLRPLVTHPASAKLQFGLQRKGVKADPWEIARLEFDAEMDLPRQIAGRVVAIGNAAIVFDRTIVDEIGRTEDAARQVTLLKSDLPLAVDFLTEEDRPRYMTELRRFMFDRNFYVGQSGVAAKRGELAPFMIESPICASVFGLYPLEMSQPDADEREERFAAVEFLYSTNRSSVRGRLMFGTDLVEMKFMVPEALAGKGDWGAYRDVDLEGYLDATRRLRRRLVGNQFDVSVRTVTR
jgi:hypothetical protein